MTGHNEFRSERKYMRLVPSCEIVVKPPKAIEVSIFLDADRQICKMKRSGTPAGKGFIPYISYPGLRSRDKGRICWSTKWLLRYASCSIHDTIPNTQRWQLRLMTQR